MGQDKHQPKDAKNKFSISEDAEKVLLGLMMTLIALIGILNRGVVGEFLTYIAVYVFGAFYYFFYIFIIAFGLYLAIKKKPFNIKVNLYLLGVIILVVSLMMAASLSIDKLSVRSIFSVYNNQMNLVSSDLFKVSNFGNLGSTGGGFIGCFLVALLNSAITAVGTRIITILLLMTGAALLLKNPLKKFFFFLKRRFQLYKAQKSGVEQKDEVADKEISEEPPVATPEPAAFGDKEPLNNYKPSPFRYSAPEEGSPLVDEKEVCPKELSGEADQNAFFNLFRRKEEPLVEQEAEVSPDLAPHLEDERNSFDRPIQVSFSAQNSTTVLDASPRLKSAPSVDRHYILPSISMLSEHRDDSKNELNIRASTDRAEQINSVFNDFKIRASVISYTIGPSVTRFNVRTDPGVRVSTISGLVREIQVALNGDKSVRIETVVQGKDTSGIEVGNLAPTPVSFKDCFSSIDNQQADKLVIPIGQDINREVITTSIDDLPHLLVAGTTGSGKSVFIHSLIMTLIMRNYPEELRLILIDPKKVEFSKYGNIPHLYCPIITDPVQATAALHKLINEMERRFTIMARAEVVNIREYRSKRSEEEEMLPNIVVIVDEFADLISNNAKEVEPLIQRLAQKARAAGIYLIVATQRPSVNVITGDIKANIPARIALSVSSTFDSKTILDEFGAETLIGKGDILARIPSRKALIRVQSAFVDNEEISRVTNYLKEQQKPVYNQDFLNLRAEEETGEEGDGNGFRKTGQIHEKFREDPMYQAIRDYVIGSGVASTSSIMRNFGLGYGRAAAFLDTLEEDGVVLTKPGGRKIVIRSSEE